MAEEEKTEDVEFETTDTEDDDVVEEQPVAEEPKQYAGKYPQFADESLEKYSSKLEQAYANSSAEALRLKRELDQKSQEFEVIQKVVGTNPALKQEFSKSLYETGYDDPFEEGVTASAIAQAIEPILDKKLDEKMPQYFQQNPALRDMTDKKLKQDREVYQEFVAAHPEVNDPAIDKEMEIAFAAQAELAVKRGEEVDLRKTLERAFATINVGEKMETNKPSINNEDAELEGMKQMAAKQEAAMSSPSSSKGTPPKGGKRVLSDAERIVAENLGLSEEDYLEGIKLAEQDKE